MSSQLPARQQVCAVPELSRLIGPYCFEELDEEQRRTFEIHLLECDSCWDHVSTLDPAVGGTAMGPTAHQEECRRAEF